MSNARLYGTRPELAIKNILVRAKSDGRAGAASDGRKLGLVVEGGAMRGVFSAGADIALELLGLTEAFDAVYGCSAGAINAAYFLAGQAAYGATIYYQDVNNKNFVNPWRGFNRVLDLDFLFEQVICGSKPLDIERILASPTRFYISITDARTGECWLPEGHDKSFQLLDALRASATHPLLSEPIARFAGRECFDGGFANPLPVQDAVSHGCTDVLVFLTRPVDHVESEPNLLMKALFKWRCAGNNRELWEAGRHMHVRENVARDLALGRRAPPSGVNIVAICPDDGDVRIKQTTTSSDALRRSAAEGKRAALNVFDPTLQTMGEIPKTFDQSLC